VYLQLFNIFSITRCAEMQIECKQKWVNHDQFSIINLCTENRLVPLALTLSNTYSTQPKK